MNTDGAGSQYVVEGIGYDFVPDVLSRETGTVDYWLKSTDEESFDAVRKLMRSEGLLVGGSSGSSLSGALRWLKSEEGRVTAQTKGANVVVLLPDGYVPYAHIPQRRTQCALFSIRNYMSKPWFLKMALEAEPSALSKQISSILQQSPSTVSTDVDRVADGIAARTKPDLDNRPDAQDEVSRSRM